MVKHIERAPAYTISSIHEFPLIESLHVRERRLFHVLRFHSAHRLLSLSLLSR